MDSRIVAITIRRRALITQNYQMPVLIELTKDLANLLEGEEKEHFISDCVKRPKKERDAEHFPGRSEEE